MFKKIKKLIKGNYQLALDQGLQVGKGVTIMGDVNFGSEPYLITLGDDVRVSSHVSFITHDGGTWAFRDQDKYKKVIKYGKIKVGNRTFIGSKATIMPGVTIGSRCVIGAGAVVTEDIPNNSVAVGVPAKVIMTTEDYAEKCLAQMKPYNEEEYKRNKKEYLLKWL